MELQRQELQRQVELDAKEMAAQEEARQRQIFDQARAIGQPSGSRRAAVRDVKSQRMGTTCGMAWNGTGAGRAREKDQGQAAEARCENEAASSPGKLVEVGTNMHEAEKATNARPGQ